MPLSRHKLSVGVDKPLTKQRQFIHFSWQMLEFTIKNAQFTISLFSVQYKWKIKTKSAENFHTDSL